MSTKRAARWGSTFEADDCWACDETFKADDEVTVVDATGPKVVHASDPCRTALVKIHNRPGGDGGR